MTQRSKPLEDTCADDFMTVTIDLSFNAKVNPKAKDPPPIDANCTFSYCLSANQDAVKYLQQVIDAINHRRLYGFMQQECADAPCAAGEWIEKSVQDMADEYNKQADREARERLGIKSDNIVSITEHKE